MFNCQLRKNIYGIYINALAHNITTVELLYEYGPSLKSVSADHIIY